MQLTQQNVWQCLRTVIDPELNIDIVSLGLVYEVSVDHDAVDKTKNKSEKKQPDVRSQPLVTIVMTLTTPGCPLAGSFDGLVRNSLNDIQGLDPIHEVEIELTFDPPWVTDMMSEEAKAELGF